MRERAPQVVFMLLLVVGLAYLVLSSADSWGDWIVFAVIVLTALGASIAIYPRLHTRRRRTISRTSD